MKPLERDRSILRHIISYCEQIEQTVAHFGNEAEVFAENKIYRNCCRIVHLADRGVGGKVDGGISSAASSSSLAADQSNEKHCSAQLWFSRSRNNVGNYYRGYSCIEEVLLFHSL